MTPASLTGAQPQPASPPTREENAVPSHFLQDSHWTAPRWIFAPTSLLEEEHPVSIRWDFVLPSGRRFTDASCASLLESSRRLIALARTHSLSTGMAQRASTARIYFHDLRVLVRWMDQEGYARFEALDSRAVLNFTHMVGARRQRFGKSIVRATVEKYLRVLCYLHRFREPLGDGLLFDPWPGQGSHAAAGVHAHQRRCGVYTPDAVAVPLVQGAIEFLATSAIPILAARERYTTANIRTHERRLSYTASYKASLRTLRERPIPTPRGDVTIHSLFDFNHLIDHLYAACFVALAYLLGARVSEIQHLRCGCVRPLHAEKDSAHSDMTIIAGAIFKLESGYHGRSHQWVAPDPAVHAISVLEALSAPHRQRSGREDLWLRTREGFRRATEWRADCTERLWIPGTDRINSQIRRFGEFLRLPDYQGQRWPLATHQGRKTFARFVALRDRTGLFALAHHLGHRDRVVTDAGYVGNDYALQREVETEVLEQSVSAWEHMLSTPALGGQAGREILTHRPRFRGATMKQQIKSYARLLVDAGLTLGVCDWGYCVYRQQHSACRGDASGPNGAYREPSTCARCKNFVLSPAHRPYWDEQLQHYQALLNNPALPTQTIKLARARLDEARAVLHSIDKASSK